MPTLSNATMLRAARKALADHLNTRPASPKEAQITATACRVAEQQLREVAAWHAEQRTGPHAQAASATLADAGRVAARAEGWERVAADPTGTWEATRAELAGRVAHYERLCGA